jgi:hypothetical protein
VNDYPGLAVCLASLYLFGLGLGGAIVRFPRAGRLLGALGIAALLFPLLIAADSVLFRALAEVFCLDLFLKAADYGRQAERGSHRSSLREFAYLLMPFPIFVAVIEEKKRLPKSDRSPLNFLRIVGGALGVVAGFGAALQLNQLAALQHNFWLDHLCRIPVFLLTVEAGSRMMLGLERLAGFDTTPLVRNVFLSLTVAEFWQRWNNRVHRWLHVNVFRPAAIQHGRVVGLWGVFIASGVLHELAFAIATGSWDGYQFAFFALQAPMVLLSDFVSRKTRRGNLAVASAMYVLTIAWMTCTSVLFLRGVDRVFEFFYVSEPWLR